MKVLSLFDGMSCGQIALKRLGIRTETYYASEIDRHAIRQTQLNFPDTIQLGDVTQVDVRQLDSIDLLIGGSPCQSFSFAGKRAGRQRQKPQPDTHGMRTAVNHTEWYQWKCSDTQQYRMLGNGWTVEVIVYIFSFLRNKINTNIA